MSPEVIIIIALSAISATALFFQYSAAKNKSTMTEAIIGDLKQQLDAEKQNSQIFSTEANGLQVRLAECEKEMSFASKRNEELNVSNEALTEKAKELDTALSSCKIESAQRESVIRAQEQSKADDTVRFMARQKELTEDIQKLKEEIDKLRSIQDGLIADKNNLIEEKTRFLAERDAQVKKQEEFVAMLEDQKKSMREEMENTMQKILEGKIEKFDDASMKALEGLLKPFKENIDGFKKKIEDNQKESSEKLVALTKEIEIVGKVSSSISQEASNLAKALKGEKQAQGRWGEMVLESVLEHSGLIKGDHYLMQDSYKDDEGKQKRTDVIIRLPEDKSIVIDSKVSLVDYDRYVNADTDELRTLAAGSLAKAFKNQIDILSSKEYSHYAIGTLQYVFMFVPIESAYSVAVKQDVDLYEYALKRNIVIVYPSTLIVTLKTIYMYWQRDKADQTIDAIYKNAGMLYDKAYALVDVFERAGRQLDTLAGTFGDAKKHLYDGNGSVVKRAQKLREMGVKTSKNLKNIKSRHISLTDEDVEVLAIEEMSENIDEVDMETSETPEA